MGDNRGWRNIEILTSKDFKCGYCGQSLASNVGYSNGANYSQKIYICHFCSQPTHFYDDRQTPGPIFGENIKGINDQSIANLYDEARRCMSCNSFTAAVICCRKLLMNIAVAKGATEGMKFIEYVEFLSTNNYVPPDGKEWVDHIRDKGNEANHEIKIMIREDAEDLITFIGMLLKFIFEFPERIKKKKSP